MKQLFLILFLFVASQTLTAQTQNQKIFFDCCNKAINYFKDFLIKQTKGQTSFEKSKNLFIKSYIHKQLLVLKSLNQIDDTSFDHLTQELTDIKTLEFKKLISKMNQQKERNNIKIGDTIVSLPTYGSGLSIYL